MLELKVYQVIEISREVKALIDEGFPLVRVEGEISNYRPHYSGHAYFTLKDEFAQLQAVMWRGQLQRLPFELKVGLKVVCTGRLTVYEKQGNYQMTVMDMQESGQGELQRRLEALRHDFEQRGYFDALYKKSMPAFPTRIGIVTSPTGAVIQDMMAIAARRNPSIQLILRPAKVQGDGAARDIATAIDEFNRYGQVDVLIVGRGGGSLEDLWAFNEAPVVEAIYRSKLPVVSAVGHESDYTLADWVADLRAPTPSAAAEILIPTRESLLGQLWYYQEKLTSLMHFKLHQTQQRLTLLQQHRVLQHPQLHLERQQEHLQTLAAQITERYQHVVQIQTGRLETLQRRLEALGPQQVLKRGFVWIQQEGQAITTAKALKDGKIKMTFSDQSIEVNIQRLMSV